MTFTALRSASAGWLARMAGFYLAVIAFVAILVVFMGRILLFPFTAWFDPASLGTHFVHDVTFLSLVLIAGLAMAVQLYRPAERVAAMQIAAVVAVFVLATNLVSSAFEPMLLVFLGPVFVAAALHPARRDLVRAPALAAGTANRPLLVLAAVAVVPVGVYAAGELVLQATLVDDHAAFGHYASMATYVLTVVALVAIAAVSGVTHRVAVYVAGFLAVLLAAASVFNPTVSAIDGTWAVLTVLWAVAVVATFEWSARASRTPQTPIDDDHEAVDAIDGEPAPR